MDVGMGCCDKSTYMCICRVSMEIEHRGVEQPLLYKQQCRRTSRSSRDNNDFIFGIRHFGARDRVWIGKGV